MKIDATTTQLIEQIYGSVPETLAQGLAAIKEAPPADQQELWSERDVVLITYADQIRSEGATPLQALDEFLVDYALDDDIRSLQFAILEDNAETSNALLIHAMVEALLEDIEEGKSTVDYSPAEIRRLQDYQARSEKAAGL